jgi:hypothetical protein
VGSYGFFHGLFSLLIIPFFCAVIASMYDRCAALKRHGTNAEVTPETI